MITCDKKSIIIFMRCYDKF